MSYQLIRAAMAAAALTMAALVSPAVGDDLDTAFTYQGRLMDGGETADGLYDLIFGLYDDAVVGAQQGADIVLGAVDVTDGLFTIELDFGDYYNESMALWLQIEVRPSGGGAFTTLVPRQKLTGAPYALGLRLPFFGEWAQNGASFAITNGHTVGTALYGEHASATGAGTGVHGESQSQGGFAKGVHGLITSDQPGGYSAGVHGENRGESGNGIGVWGSHDGSGWGVLGESVDGHGVFGSSSGGYGVRASSTDGTGVYATTGGLLGVYGRSTSQDAWAYGVHGHISNSSSGSSSAGVRGENSGTNGLGIGVHGSHAGSGWGVLGESPGGVAIYGITTTGTGVYASSGSGTGVSGTTGGLLGVYGRSSSQDAQAYGVHGRISSSSPGSYSAGVRGENQGTGGLGIGVWGSHNGSGWGVLGESPSGVGVYGSSTTGYAGYFGGNVTVTGTLAKGGGSFRIDHPLDPTNKYLQHSFVESPDMMNIYNGNVRLDENGAATIEMPEWFEALLNTDFRYQLTPIGAPGPNLHVARTIEDRSFAIAGGQPGMEVSWQVTGIRRDPYAETNRIQVEVDKPADERGTYLHPDAYGVDHTSTPITARRAGGAE